MYNYLTSFIWNTQIIEDSLADEKQKRAKYLVCEQIKISNFKLKKTKILEPIIEKKLKKKLNYPN